MKMCIHFNGWQVGVLSIKCVMSVYLQCNSTNLVSFSYLYHHTTVLMNTGMCRDQGVATCLLPKLFQKGTVLNMKHANIEAFFNTELEMLHSGPLIGDSWKSKDLLISGNGWGEVERPDLVKAAILGGVPHTWSGRLIFRQHGGILTLRLKHFHISAAVGFGGVLCWLSIIHEAWPPFTSCHRADHWIPSGPWGTSPASIREAVRWARWHGNSQGGSHLPKLRPPPTAPPIPFTQPSSVPLWGWVTLSRFRGCREGGGCALIQAEEEVTPPPTPPPPAAWTNTWFCGCTITQGEGNI